MHQEQNETVSLPLAASPVLAAPHVQPASVNLLLTGATPINNLPEVSFQTPASGASLAPSSVTRDTLGNPVQPHSLNPYDIQFMPTLITSSLQVQQTGSQIDIVPSAIPLSASPPPSSPFNKSNYAHNGPYINADFSKVVNLPLTPSPPPLLEADENVESSNSVKMNATPTKHLEYETNKPSIPLSHLITANQYPSLTRIPPAHIAQSFAPMYVSQQQHTYQQQLRPNEREIYSDYVNDPYNLTLHVDQSYNNVGSEIAVTSTASMASTVSASNTNVFQSVNYFGSANDAAIPPGSEMLFGAP